MTTISFCILFLTFGVVLGKKTLCTDKTFVFGPGLNANIVLPVRYFYVHAVDTKGKNYTSSPGKDTFTLQLNCPETNRVRAWREILDRKDGSFIIRFRLYETYKDLTVAVKHNGKHVAQSPYILKGLSYHEQCDCPERSTKKWLSDMKCHDGNHQQIDADLKPFPSINLDDMFKRGVERHGTNNAICYYSIIDNQIYRKCYGQHVGFAIFMDAWLLSLARKVRLPDIEFFSNLGDWPLSRRGTANPVPIFSWCGSDETFDFVMPTYDLTESTLESLGRVSLDMMSVQGNTGPRWKKKIEKGFFRGRDSRQERLDLTVLGRSMTDLFDVGLTNFFFFKYDEKKYGPKNKHISFFDFFKYKYQLNVDGTVAAYRFPYLLAGNSVVFKQESSYYEHFYHDLLPMKHYIPFRRNLSDIVDKLKWAKQHDGEVRKIALDGQRYARDNLLADKLYCYSFKLFQEYSKRITGTPQVRDGMEHIKQPTDDHVCNCERKTILKKKKSVEKKHVEL